MYRTPKKVEATRIIALAFIEGALQCMKGNLCSIRSDFSLTMERVAMQQASLLSVTWTSSTRNPWPKSVIFCNTWNWTVGKSGHTTLGRDFCSLLNLWPWFKSPCTCLTTRVLLWLWDLESIPRPFNLSRVYWVRCLHLQIPIEIGDGFCSPKKLFTKYSECIQCLKAGALLKFCLKRLKCCYDCFVWRLLPCPLFDSYEEVGVQLNLQLIKKLRHQVWLLVFAGCCCRVSVSKCTSPWEWGKVVILLAGLVLSSCTPTKTMPLRWSTEELLYEGSR